MPDRVCDVPFPCTGNVRTGRLAFLALPVSSLDQVTLVAPVREIGRQAGATSRCPEVA